MKKKFVGLKIYSLLLLLIGVWALYIPLKHGLGINDGTAPAGNWVTFFVFVAYSIGIFTLINWVRIAIVIASSIIIALFIIPLILLILLKPENWQWGLIAISAFSPVIALGICSLVYLTRPKVKEQFKA